MICLGGIFLAGIAWLNLKVADMRSKMTEEERRRFDEELDEDMRW
jgi:hypothetical protein